MAVNKLLHRVWCTKLTNYGHQVAVKCYCSKALAAEKADIVISGGGMVGGALAAALSQNELFGNKRIVLLETLPKKDYQPSECFSNRTCALSPATVTLLKSFGAWDHILQMRCQPVKRMQVWESCSNSLITFNNEDMNEKLAFIVENDVIQAAINKQIKKGHVEVQYETKAVGYTFPGDVPLSERKPWVQVHLNNGTTINTQLLVGADGSMSTVRTQAKMHTVQLDYKQSAVVATLHLTEATENFVAWQRFLPTGPIALLPLADNVSSLVWTTVPERARDLLRIPKESFVDAVNDALWHERDKNTIADTALDFLTSNILPGSQVCRQLPPTVVGVDEHSRAAFPLNLVHASQYVKPRVALIGDAAHRIHPLAGQGVNLGFGDVTCLTELLTKAVEIGSDLGSLNHLLDYETRRQRDVLPITATIDALQRLYSTDLTPVVVLRTLGLHVTNSLDFIKRKIIQQASA